MQGDIEVSKRQNKTCEMHAKPESFKPVDKQR